MDVASSRKDHAFMIFNGCLARDARSVGKLSTPHEDTGGEERQGALAKVAELTRADAREGTKMQSSTLNRVVEVTQRPT